MVRAKRAICNDNDLDPSESCEAGVAVPAGLFKLIYLPEAGRAFAFLMPNISHTNLKRASGRSVTDYLDQYRVSISVLEDATILNFFPRSTRREARVREENCIATRWR
jgi:DNA/RNA endonuclease G (NUC1)